MLKEQGRLKTVLIICTLMTLGACSTIDTAEEKSNYCSIFKFIKPTETDAYIMSDDLAHKLLTHNEIYFDRCYGKYK